MVESQRRGQTLSEDGLTLWYGKEAEGKHWCVLSPALPSPGHIFVLSVTVMPAPAPSLPLLQTANL